MACAHDLADVPRIRAGVEPVMGFSTEEETSRFLKVVPAVERAIVDSGILLIDMFKSTDTPWAPWHVAHTDDKKRGRLNIISHLLSQVPYEPLEPSDVKVPERQGPDGYVEPDLPLNHIPDKY